jgi:GT2 family glycosyltransferase
MKTVGINILVFNHSEYVERCIESVLGQTYPSIKIMVMDNNSSDNSVDIVRESFSQIPITINENNIGFASGHNRAAKMLKTFYFMPLNPDVFMTPTFVEELVNAIESGEDIGMAGGKLLRPDRSIDSIGLALHKNRKNYEIGSGEIDNKQYDNKHFIFGPLGAAPLYKMDMLEDISIDGEYFDEDFFAYREEVDLAWRAQLKKWKCIYSPKAIALHVHAYNKKTRNRQPKFNRYLQFRNRYFMIIKNDNIWDIMRHLIPILAYEIMAFVFAVLREPFLLRAYFDVILKLKRIIKKRKTIMREKKADERYILQWFMHERF